MARTGRPKDPNAKRRQFALRVTAEEEQEILELAAKTDLSASEVIRTALVAAKVFGRNPGSIPLAFLPEGTAEVKRAVVSTRSNRTAQA